MAKFVAISGPSSTGKTSLINELMQYDEFLDAIFFPDIFSSVWDDLVQREVFSEYEDFSRDSEFLCIFIQRVIDYYESIISEYKNQDRLIILDSCWVDLSIYSIINMWYSHVLKDLQESFLKKLNSCENDIMRVYLTTFDESKHQVEKYKIPFKRYNVKYNRPLELQYYKLASHFENTTELPTSDLTESALFILDDLQNLGYL